VLNHRELRASNLFDVFSFLKKPVRVQNRFLFADFIMALAWTMASDQKVQFFPDRAYGLARLCQQHLFLRPIRAVAALPCIGAMPFA
jgi:hypothetical protein